MSLGAILIPLAGVLAVWWFRPGDAWRDDFFNLLGALALIGLMAIGLFVWEFISIPPLWAEKARRRVKAAERRTSELTSKPERISLVELAALAEERFGWVFADSSLLHSMDFTEALRHAGHEEYLVLEGRRGCHSQPEYRKHEYLFDKIPKAHYEDYYIQLALLDVPRATNFFITTYAYGPGVNDAERYCDLHFSDRVKATVWLEKYAGEWKGRAVEAERMRAEKHKEWEAQMREQGHKLVGDPDSEQGTHWVKRTDAESDEGA